MKPIQIALLAFVVFAAACADSSEGPKLPVQSEEQTERLTPSVSETAELASEGDPSSMGEMKRPSLEEKESKVVALNESQKKLFKERKQLMFFIHRTKNRNLVLYEAATNSQSVDKLTGVTPKWKMLERKDKRLEKLAWYERSAYGCNLETKNGESTLELNAMRKVSRPPIFRVTFDEQKKRWIVKTRIDGRESQLKRIWVEHGTGIVPDVYWVDLYGIDKSGNGLTQRYNIEAKPK